MLGVCYYPEHWSKERWPNDAKKMRALGLSYVRVGEFAWSRYEPEPGHYDFGWLEDAIDVLAAEGLKVIIGTPTATPPKWLIDQYPEILPVDPDTGATRRFGSRRHYDFSSDVYLRESVRITEALVKYFVQHPAVVGWQTDNELCCHDTTLSGSESARLAFQAWCEHNYASIEALNDAWGNVFWSMEYRSFDEIPLPIAAVTETNPAHRFAYRRFSSDQVIRYHTTIIETIRRHSPDKFVTHNFIPTSDTNTDNFALAEGLDFTSYDNYPLGRTDLYFGDWNTEQMQKYMRTGHPDYGTFFHDQTRSLSKGEYWVMEQQPGPVNWAEHNPRPLAGMVRFWTLEAFAHGANCVCYFRWRQAPFAQEQMHSGLLRPDDSPATAWAEIEQVRTEIAQLKLADLPAPKNRVAVLISIEGQWLSDIEKQGVGYDFWRIQFAWYNALRTLGVDVDYISADGNFDQYTLIVAPAYPILDDTLVAKIGASKAQFIFGPRSGAKDYYCAYPHNLPPGPLQKILPIRVLSVETLRPDCADTFTWREKVYNARCWREEIDSGDATVHARFKNAEPAILSAANVTYIAALTDEVFLLDYLQSECERLSVSTYRSSPDVRISHRGDLGFAFNYSDVPVELSLPENAECVLGNRQLGAYDVTVWR